MTSNLVNIWFGSHVAIELKKAYKREFYGAMYGNAQARKESLDACDMLLNCPMPMSPGEKRMHKLEQK